MALQRIERKADRVFRKDGKNEKRDFSTEEMAEERESSGCGGTAYSWRAVVSADSGFHAARRYFLFMRPVNAPKLKSSANIYDNARYRVTWVSTVTMKRACITESHMRVPCGFAKTA